MQRFPDLVVAAGASLVVFAACGGKVVVESSGASGSGGAGGSSTASAVLDGPFSAVAVVAVASTSAGDVGSSGITTGSGMSCVSCAQAATDLAVTTSDVCPGAQPLYDDLFACACAGACATQCSATACIGQATPDVCTKCLGDPEGGCGAQLQKCLANN